ncbi:MAG: T9SS type A sorting domain-containing protein [Bacteroidales bacterium]|nr:T9SS type A sorting domain-containing protein [Bacteroidales bacterium]
MKNFRLFTIALFIACFSYPVSSQTTSLGDTLGAFNAGILTPTPDRSLRGIEFAESHYWLTGFDPDAGWQRKLYKINAEGDSLIQYWTYSTLMENWVDLAYDGEFLYGAGIDTVYQVDMTTSQRTGVQFKTPPYYHRGLTYDPATGHFWVSGDDNLIYEMDIQGNVIKAVPFIQDLPTSGLAWDTWTEGGPYLWVFSMKYTSTDVRPKAYQINPANGQLTGVTFEGVNMNPFGVDQAFSFTLSDQIIPGKVVFAALQGSNYQTNNDQLAWVVLYDLSPETTGVPGPEVVVSPNAIQNDLLPGDSVYVPVYIGNLSELWDLNWFATLEYPNMGTTDPGSGLFQFDVTALTDPDFDKNMRSMTFINDQIYIITYPDFGVPAYIYRIAKDGSEIISKDIIPGGFGSTWYSITSDGEYLYAASQYVIAKIDPETYQTIDFTINTNFFAASMAIDPQNENFYLANGGIIRKISKQGQQLNFYTTLYNIKGLAWDSWSPGAPYLWVYHQSGSTGAIEAIRLEPETGNQTGVSFAGANLSIDSTYIDMAKNIFVSPDWQENKLVMLALHDSFTELGEGADQIVVYDLDVIPPPGWIKLLPPSAGTAGPQETDTLYIRLMAIMEDTLMNANLVINSNDVLNPKIYVPVNFMMLPNTTTGISELNSTGDGLIRSMFPNPAAETVNLQFGEAIVNGRIEIYNTLGTLVFSNEIGRNAGTYSFDIRNLSSGLYHLIILNGSSKDQRKLMIR